MHSIAFAEVILSELKEWSNEEKTAILALENADGHTPLQVLVAEEAKALAGLNLELQAKRLKTLTKLRQMIG